MVGESAVWWKNRRLEFERPELKALTERAVQYKGETYLEVLSQYHIHSYVTSGKTAS